MTIGKRVWVFADGDLPPHPADAGEPKAHEALMVVNSNDRQAKLAVTLLFENSEPKTNLALVVPPRRVSCFRMDQPIWGGDYVIPFGQYAVVVESDVPVVAVFGRLDRRQNMAYYPVAPYVQ
jgi:hypothetical protein